MRRKWLLLVFVIVGGVVFTGSFAVRPIKKRIGMPPESSSSASGRRPSHDLEAAYDVVDPRSRVNVLSGTKEGEVDTLVEEVEQVPTAAYVTLGVLFVTFASNQWSRQAIYYLCNFGADADAFKHMNAALNFDKEMYATLASIAFTLVFAVLLIPVVRRLRHQMVEAGLNYGVGERPGRRSTVDVTPWYLQLRNVMNQLLNRSPTIDR